MKERRDCRHCGKPFTARFHATVYCGNDCYFAARSKRQKERKRRKRDELRATIQKIVESE